MSMPLNTGVLEWIIRQPASGSCALAVVSAFSFLLCFDTVRSVTRSTSDPQKQRVSLTHKVTFYSTFMTMGYTETTGVTYT